MHNQKDYFAITPKQYLSNNILAGLLLLHIYYSSSQNMSKPIVNFKFASQIGVVMNLPIIFLKKYDLHII